MTRTLFDSCIANGVREKLIEEAPGKPAADDGGGDNEDRRYSTTRWRLQPIFTLLLFLGLTHGTSGLLHAQCRATDLRQPLDGQISLSGSYHEIRSSHFHGGLDLRTGGQEGKPVYAAEDGFVSRIRVQGGGYGHALYIDHPSGCRTVYGHLQRFTDDIQAEVRRQQYRRESFELTLFPNSESFPVERGQLIGYSGNTGSSGGPHLHFEVRNAANDVPLDPRDHGIDVGDSRSPLMFSLRAYVRGSRARVRHVDVSGRVTEGTAFRPLDIPLVHLGGARYQLRGGGRIQVAGEVAFAIAVEDRHDHSNFRLGVRRIELMRDDETLFGINVMQIPFNQHAYVKAHVDYAARATQRHELQRLHKLPGNPLAIYDGTTSGWLSVDETERFDVIATDADANEATLAFYVEPGPSAAPEAVLGPDLPLRLLPDRAQSLSGVGWRATVTAGTVYDTTFIRLEGLEDVDPAAGVMVELDVGDEALHRGIELSLDAAVLADTLRPFAALERTALGGATNWFMQDATYRDGWVVGTVYGEGRYRVAVDTTAPVISLDGIRHDVVDLTVRDEGVGLRSFRGTIDGVWTLCAHDPKRSDIQCERGAGGGLFEFVSEDRKGNRNRISLAL